MAAALATCLVIGPARAGPTALAPGDDARRLRWGDLMPAGWDPLGAFGERYTPADRRELLDGSNEAQRMLAEYRTAVASAPVVGALDGERVRLPGFVAPLEFAGKDIREFLLVPYYGACIHTPPPPANQVVHVTLEEAYPMSAIYGPVWVTGTLRTDASHRDLGDAGYTMKATRIEPYEP